jgi:hypothetical protein
MKDPRIRGTCGSHKCHEFYDRRLPRPSKNKYNNILVSSFRVGTIVKYNNIERVVVKVNFYYDKSFCCFSPGNRIVTTLDLGAPDNNIPWDLVEIIKY